MDSKFFMNTRDQLAQGYDEITGWDPPTFQHILDQFHQPLYRYYAVHTGGELTQAQRMTAETLSIVYRLLWQKRTSRAGSSALPGMC